MSDHRSWHGKHLHQFAPATKQKDSASSKPSRGVTKTLNALRAVQQHRPTIKRLAEVLKISYGNAAKLSLDLRIRGLVRLERTQGIRGWTLALTPMGKILI